MQSNASDDRRLWALLGAFRSGVLEHMQGDLASMAGIEISLPQSLALTEIAQAGPLTVAGLQARLRRSQATTSHLVSQLELRGLVERTDDPSDARRTLVRLAAGGRELMKNLEKARARAFARVLGKLSPKLRRRLTAVLAETVAALEEK